MSRGITSGDTLGAWSDEVAERLVANMVTTLKSEMPFDHVLEVMHRESGDPSACVILARAAKRFLASAEHMAGFRPDNGKTDS